LLGFLSSVGPRRLFVPPLLGDSYPHPRLPWSARSTLFAQASGPSHFRRFCEAKRNGFAELCAPLRCVRMVRNSSWLLEWTTVGYLALLRHDRRVSGPPGVPEVPWHNVVLKNHDEVAGRLNRSQDSICPPWAIHPRTGIGLAAVDCILKATTPKAHILDAGPRLTRGSCRGCAWMDTEDCRPST